MSKIVQFPPRQWIPPLVPLPNDSEVWVITTGEEGSDDVMWLVAHVASNENSYNRIGVYATREEATHAGRSYARAVGAKFDGGAA